jgi:diguanylate cyclase (GGDEF)-like protein
MIGSVPVLIVDDDSEFRAFVAAALDPEYEVVGVGRGAQALQQLELRAFELLIIDGLLPDIRGAELIAQIRKTGVKTPIVFASAFWTRDRDLFRRLTTELSVSRVLGKPLSAEELLTEVRGIVHAPSVPKAATISSKLEAVRERFKAKLGGKLRALIESVEAAAEQRTRESIQQAHLHAHTVHGTAGSFGFADIGDRVGRMEAAFERMLETPDLVRNDGFWSVLRTELDALRPIAAAGTVAPAEAGPQTAAVRASARVLLVDDDPAFRSFMVEAGRSALVEVVEASNGSSAIDAASSGKPLDGIFLDISLPGENSFEIAVALRSLPSTAAVPIAFVSAEPDLKNRIEAAHAGASVFLSKPITETQFLSVVEQQSVQRRARRPSVLVIDDDPAFIELLRTTLEDAEITVHEAQGPFDVLPALERYAPDVFLVDALMPGASGYDLCRIVRAVPRWRDLPVLVLSAQTSTEARIACFKAGADDYIQKPFLREELLARVGHRIERSRLVRDLASRDYLTGLHNRREFLEVAAQRIAQADRSKLPLSFALLDLDNFKQVNDRHGHLAGDRVLAAMGRLLLSRFRTEDVRGRWGGEEIALLFPNSAGVHTKALLERVAADFRRMEFQGENGAFSTTFSGGVATYPVDGTGIAELMKKADRLLYRAKELGRDQIQC